MLLAQILVNGILLGGLYGLMALGMALVWGVLNIVNLAHGAMIMLGGYIVYYLFAGLGLDPFAALPVAVVAMFVFGYLLQRFVLNLIVRSATLQGAVRRLDATMHAPADPMRGKFANPVERQLGLLKAAFEQDGI